MDTLESAVRTIRIDDPQAAASQGHIETLTKMIRTSLAGDEPRTVRIALGNEKNRSSHTSACSTLCRELNNRFREICVFHLSDQALISCPLPPYDLSLPKLRREIDSFAGAFAHRPDAIFQTSREHWQRYIQYAQKCLKEEEEKARKDGKSLSPERTGERLRGAGAEFELLQLLVRYARAHEKDLACSMRMLHREDRVVLPQPKANLDAAYSLFFTTLFNCEIHCTTTHPTPHAGKRGGKAFERSTHTMTEVDAALLTGLDPSKPKQFSKMYLFDATTGKSAFDARMTLKLTHIEDFIRDMDARGVEVHLVHVLFFRPDDMNRVDKFRVADNERNHVICLPLLDQAIAVAERTAKELEVEMV